MRVHNMPLVSGAQYDFGQTMLFDAFTFATEGTSFGKKLCFGRRLFNYGRYINTTEDGEFHVFEGRPIEGGSLLYFHVRKSARIISLRR